MAIVYINSLTFSDGNTLTFNEDDIVVFVGANNSGKSASLKEIVKMVRNRSIPTNVIHKLNYVKKGDIDAMLKLIANSSKIEINKSNGYTYYKGIGYEIFESRLRESWNHPSDLGDLTQILVNLLSTEDRLTAANPPKSVAFTTQAPTHPIHYLQKDDRIEMQFSAYFKQAFGQDLIVHRNAGSEVPLYIGDRPIMQTGEDRVSATYIERLEKLPLLQEQGDGMRGFVGVLLNTFISSRAILLIDEPEAFLHPPQARLLGKCWEKICHLESSFFYLLIANIF